MNKVKKFYKEHIDEIAVVSLAIFACVVTGVITEVVVTNNVTRKMRITNVSFDNGDCPIDAQAFLTLHAANGQTFHYANRDRKF